MGFKVNVQKMKDYVELIYPKGAYEGKIVKAEEKISESSGREFYALQIEVSETIPAGGEIDTEQFDNPLGKTLFTNVMLPIYGVDKPNTVNMFEKKLSDLIKYGEVETAKDDELEASDLLNRFVGIVIGHTKVNKDDPNSALKAEITGFTALP